MYISLCPHGDLVKLPR